MTAIAMFALSVTVYEIFTNEIKYKMFDLEMKVRVKRRKKRN